MSKNKKPEKKSSLFSGQIKQFKNKGYSWTLNLGVVPLFFITFFLLAPVLALLAFLRISVFFDNETINSLLQMIINNKKNLTFKTHSVKAFLGLALVLCLSSPELWAQTDKDENIIIAIGEHKEIPLPKLERFTLSNSDCLTHKFIEKSKIMLIKGAKLGYSELVVWNKDKAKTIFRIYVLTKQKQLQIIHLVQTIEATGLKTELSGPLILIKGELKRLEDYFLIKKIEKENKENIQTQGKLHPKLRNELIAEIYKRFISEGISPFECHDINYSLICEYSQRNAPSKEILEELKNRYSIDFVGLRSGKEKNYLIKLKLIQIEKLDGEELNFGLNQVSGNLGELFHSGLVGIIEKNQFLLNQTQIHLSTLAEPETVIRLGQSAAIDVGAEISFPVAKSRADGIVQSTEWKFAGLKIKLDLNRFGEQFQIQYETEFSRPVDNDSKISGNKEKSSLNITLNRPIQVFQIGFKTDGNNVSSLPWLSSIPLLGEIFKSKSTQSNYKKITGLIVLEEYES